MSLALAARSSRSLNGSATTTGPKISSLTTFMSPCVLISTVGSMKKPRSPNVPPPASAVAPSALPDSRKLLTRLNCSSDTIGPIWVLTSKPEPSLIDFAISATPPTTSSKRFWCTNSREPATQHWPWLKKMALADPSIAASSASSKTMFGLLPPSSRLTFFRLPGGRVHDELAHVG